MPHTYLVVQLKVIPTCGYAVDTEEVYRRIKSSAINLQKRQFTRSELVEAVGCAVSVRYLPLSLLELFLSSGEHHL